jgi:hypothetical protein
MWSLLLWMVRPNDYIYHLFYFFVYLGTGSSVLRVIRNFDQIQLLT